MLMTNVTRNVQLVKSWVASRVLRDIRRRRFVKSTKTHVNAVKKNRRRKRDHDIMLLGRKIGQHKKKKSITEIRKKKWRNTRP